jgi:hypothetical protein
MSVLCKDDDTHQPSLGLKGPVGVRDILVGEALAHDGVVVLVPLPGTARRVDRVGRAAAAGRVLFANQLGLEIALDQTRRRLLVSSLLELLFLGVARSRRCCVIVQGSSGLVGTRTGTRAARVEVTMVWRFA